MPAAKIHYATTCKGLIHQGELTVAACNAKGKDKGVLLTLFKNEVTCGRCLLQMRPSRAKSPYEKKVHCMMDGNRELACGRDSFGMEATSKLSKITCGNCRLALGI